MDQETWNLFAMCSGIALIVVALFMAPEKRKQVHIVSAFGVPLLSGFMAGSEGRMVSVILSTWFTWSVCLFAFESYFVIIGAAKRKETEEAKIKECLESVCLHEDATVVDVSVDLHRHNPRHRGFHVSSRSDWTVRSYKYGNKDYFSRIQLDNFDDVYDRVKAKTEEKLEDAGLNILYDTLTKIEMGLGFRPERIPTVHDIYDCKTTKEEYDGFDGTPRPVTVDVYPFRRTDIVDSVQERKEG